jgi:ABC-type sugar transport system permease subunit
MSHSNFNAPSPASPTVAAPALPASEPQKARVAKTSLPPSRRRHFSAVQIAPWVFLAPYIILTLVFFFYPFFQAMVLALYQTVGTTTRAWVGLDNFTFILGEVDFRRAVFNTMVFAAANAVLMLPISLGLALLLNSGKDRLKGIFRLILFSPNVVGQIFVGIIFAVIFVPRYGLFNRFLHDLLGWGLETQWLQDPTLVMPAIVLTNLWLYAGFNMIYFLAALQSVDQSLVEAAKIDGAGPWAVFRNVTFPAIKPVAIFVLVISTINAFQLFELPFALLRGFGPANSGLTIVGYLYDAAYNIGDLGLASAVGWILALIMLTVSVAQIGISGTLREENQT